MGILFDSAKDDINLSKFIVKNNKEIREFSSIFSTNSKKNKLKKTDLKT
jgi:hypothetical protein